MAELQDQACSNVHRMRKQEILAVAHAAQWSPLRDAAQAYITPYEARTATHNELWRRGYCFHPGYAVHQEDTGYGYTAGRRLTMPAYEWKNGTYHRAQDVEKVREYLARHCAATVANDRQGYGIESF